MQSFDFSQPSYTRFRSILREGTRRVLIWYGAGPSKQASLPLWTELRGRLTDELSAKAANLSENSTECEKMLNGKRIAEQENDPWIAMTILKRSLGMATYIAAVRQQLTPNPRKGVPELYKQFWKLPISGIFTLNMDRLATQAYTQIHPGIPLYEFTGYQSGTYAHLLQTNRKFIVNLHGVVDDDSSWVLTHEDLDRLLESVMDLSVDF